MAKVITSFDIDLSSMAAASNTRTFSITGDNGAIFSLEIKNEDGYYTILAPKLLPRHIKD